MKENRPRKETTWRGMALFTRALLLFLGGLFLLFLRGQVAAHPLSSALAVLGYLCFLAGFVVASWGTGEHWREHWQEMAPRQSPGDRKDADPE